MVFLMTPLLFLWTQDLNLALLAAAIFVDAGVAARAISDSVARHRYCLGLQCAPLHRLTSVLFSAVPRSCTLADMARPR
jgi:hypothetical protein